MLVYLYLLCCTSFFHLCISNSSHLGADACGRSMTLVPNRRHCRLRQSRLHPNFTGYKRLNLPFSPHFASIQSFLAWTCPPTASSKNLMDRNLAFLSYCVVVYVYCIGASSITFMFFITSVHITYTASCWNGEAEEGDKGMAAIVYMATRWTYNEMCVLWKHDAI